ncbi:MAG TPA: FAD-dependent oxidoreductase [Syntrophorhabdales bacterium]|nr:FAD-dependent oxidoreductase [Syntrophorhabdales bacterium]
MKVVIVGGGWAGCAAAIAARKQGAEVSLLERTDMLLGCGLVGGIMRNNGRFTAAEEMLAMSGGDLFRLTDQTSLHQNMDFPSHRHSSMYNSSIIEPVVKQFLLQKGVQIQLVTRIDDAEMQDGQIKAVTGKTKDEKVRVEGDVFIDTTGTAGPPAQCTKYGNGCAMCILRCPSFGGRASLTAKCGVTELVGRKGDRIGAMSGACEVHKETLSREIVETLNKTGVVVIPVPAALQSKGKLEIKACQQYALPEFSENLVILDNGHAKLMVPFFPLEILRQLPGMEQARYKDPYAGGQGNSIRYIGMAPRDDALKVKGVENLFCAGEKAGLLVGITEAMVTGELAGHNAVKWIKREKPLVLPDTLAVGDAISHVRTRMETEEGLAYKYTFSGSVYFDRMLEKNLYLTDPTAIRKKVEEAGLAGVLA